MFHPQGPTFFELARQCLSSTEQGYDLLAPKFDLTPFRTPDRVLEVVAQRVRSLGPVDSLLDVCCGTGAALHWLGPQCRRAVGIDFSRGMLEVARAHGRGQPSRTQIDYVRGHALEMPFAAGFDLVVSFSAFGHILPTAEPQLVRQIAAALKPGGKFLFVTSTMPAKWSRAYWLARGFNAAMHLRNALVAPPFVMYYLTFLLPQVQGLLERHGFRVDVSDPFDGPHRRLRLVIATLESGPR